jgi:hypothetical protein
MRKTLLDYELRYSELEKKSLALVNAVVHFQTYILNSLVIGVKNIEYEGKLICVDH